MKTKRLIQLMSFMMFIVASVCVSSCKSDPEETTPPTPDPTPSIVGTWRWNFSEKGYVIVTFNADGTGKEMEFDHGKWDPEKNFKYVYKDNKLYYTYFSEGRQKDITEIYDVISLTATTLLIKDFGDEGISTFTRQDNAQTQETSASIVGTWRWNFSENGYCILKFNADGTGREREFDHGDWEDDHSFKYVYKDNKLYYTYFSEGRQRDYTEIYDIISLTATTLLIKDFGDLGISTFTRQ